MEPENQQPAAPMWEVLDQTDGVQIPHDICCRTKPENDTNCKIGKQGIDGAGHIIAGCKDQHIKGVYINRHNRDVNIIQAAVYKGALRNSYMIMGAGKNDALLDKVRMQSMPDSLRPPNTITS